MMKKLLFLFFLPLWGLGIAHASVAVQVLATDFPNQQVTLRVEYDNAVNDRVWVWIYLCDIQGMFQPAVISAASTTGNNVVYTSTNTRGFFVIGSPTTVTATLSNAPDQFSCCAYGSDAPPNMTESNGTYTFKGTPPFILTDADGTTKQTVSGNTLPVSALTVTPIFLTDETGYSDVLGSCSYAGSDLYWDASHPCPQRTSGAQNWEAYIKDVRDNQIYRIVQMPTGIWWMADDLVWDGKPSHDATNYTVHGMDRTCGAHYGCGRFYQPTADDLGVHEGDASARRASVVCPTGWLLPSRNDASPYINSNQWLTYTSSKEIGGIDTYGLSLYACDGWGGQCGSAAITYVVANGIMWHDAIKSGSQGFNQGGAIDGLNVRCVRIL
jgi:uncharacterized protein (TIGR02145 family)